MARIITRFRSDPAQPGVRLLPFPTAVFVGELPSLGLVEVEVPDEDAPREGEDVDAHRVRLRQRYNGSGVDWSPEIIEADGVTAPEGAPRLVLFTGGDRG